MSGIDFYDWHSEQRVRVADLRATFSMTTEASPNAVRKVVQDLEAEFISALLSQGYEE